MQAAGPRLLCLIDGSPVLEAALPQARSGRIGFYSVDSRAAFGGARVTAVAAPEQQAAAAAAVPAEAAALQSFWFTENFAKQPSRWEACADWKPTAPWLVAEGACVQLAEKGRQMNLLEGFDLYDGQIHAVCLSAGGSAGLVFRRSGQRCYLFQVSVAENQARLLALDGGQSRVLAASSDPGRVRRALSAANFIPEVELAEEETKAPRPTASLVSLRLIFQGQSLRAGVNNDMLLEATDDTLTHGSVGFCTEDGKAVFLELNAAAPVEGH